MAARAREPVEFAVRETRFDYYQAEGDARVGGGTADPRPADPRRKATVCLYLAFLFIPVYICLTFVLTFHHTLMYR